MKLSPQKLKVIDWVANGSGSAFIEAVAGAGKTTTLVEALKSTKGTVAFAAYNKKIADEIAGKVRNLNFGNRVQIGTFHSFGYRSWRRAYPSVKMDAKAKEFDTYAKFRNEWKVPEALEGFVMKLVELAKNRAVGLNGSIEDMGEWYDIINHFDLSHDLELAPPDVTIERGIDFAIKTLRWHQEISPKLINFDDMIYMPVVSGVKPYENDWVFVDEAQDTNPARRALARKLLKPSGRSIWVGDRHQAIYGFTGADNDAIDRIITEFHCASFPLTITFRCPKAVVEEARKTVAHIEADSTAPEGYVEEMGYDAFKKLNDLSAQDAILCRKTAPLVSLAYDLIRRGIGCHVEGRDIGAGLIKLIGRWKRVRTLDKLRECLEEYSDKESEKLIAKGRETAAEALRDRVETIFTIMEGNPPVTTIDELRSRISSMFLDGEYERKPTLTLSTVHKSKGREWPRVFILGRRDYMPSTWARQQWQKEQEQNIIYVAVTRSMDKLVLINGVEEEKRRGE